VTRDVATPEELSELEQLIDDWFERQKETLPILLDVSRDEDVERRWYARLEGEERDVTTVWLTLGQRTLKYETYFLPYPEDNKEKVFELLLRRNYDLVGAQFGIGPEEAIFLTGELPFHAVDENELDRILGSMWEYVERYWCAALKMGFGNRLKNESEKKAD
jgi:hypothetical protein